MTRDPNNCTCCDMSFKDNWNSSHVSPFKWERSWDKRTFTSKCPVATDATATTHAMTRQSMPCVPPDLILAMFSMNTWLKNGQNTTKRKSDIIDCKRITQNRTQGMHHKKPKGAWNDVTELHRTKITTHVYNILTCSADRDQSTSAELSNRMKTSYRVNDING